jgi:membrane protein implicated in regulation of membrane protease activity
MMIEEDGRSLSHLFATALTQLSLLVQTEIRLALAEIGQKLSTIAIGTAIVGLAVVFLVPALTLLLFAIAAWLTQHGLSTAGADAISGAGAFIIAGLLLIVGLRRLRPESLRPNRALAQLQRDATVAREHLG